MRSLSILLILLLVVPGSTARSQTLRCSGSQKPWMVAELLFAREHVSDRNWDRFLAMEITRRFPEGLTVYDARGQWRPPGKQRILRERTKVVMIAAPPGPDNDARLQQVIKAYKTHFKQQSVGLIVHPACVSF
jgi:hypothetical protein